MTVWIYHHGVKLDTKQCWDYFCAAGGELLNLLLDFYKSDPEVSLSPEFYEIVLSP